VSYYFAELDTEIQRLSFGLTFLWFHYSAYTVSSGITDCSERDWS